MGSNLEPQSPTYQLYPFPPLPCCILQFGSLSLSCSPYGWRGLCAFAHPGVFIQLQDLSRSYMTRKFETIPYYSAQKKWCAPMDLLS